MQKKNRKMNKIMASAITASVATSAIVSFAPNANAAATNFKDVPSNEYFFEAINSLHARNIINGFGDGTFRPNEIITRAQAAKILALALDLDMTIIKDPGFKDVPKENWSYQYISALANKGIIAGYGDEFKPNDPLTRAQMAKIISLAYHLQTDDSKQLPFTDVKHGDWFANYVGALVGNEITSGTTPTTFSPNKNVTRGQIAAFVYRSENKVGPVQVYETISNITNETLVTSDGTYTLSDEQKKWINPSNLAALNGATIKLTAQENKIEKIQWVELIAKGSKSTDTSNPYANHVVFDGKGATVDANITVNGDYVVMKNVTIKGDLHIGKGVENSLFSEFTRVEGKTTIDDSLQVVNQTNQGYNSLEYKVAATKSFQLAANETATRGRVVFSEFQLGDVGVDKNADVIFLSKTQGTSSVGEIVFTSNATLTADSSVTIPKVVIAEGAKDIAINSKVTALQVKATGEVKLSGKGDIANLTVSTNANVALQTQGKVGTLETVNKEAKVTLGTETKVGNLVVPSGSKPSDIIGNYDSVKTNVEQIGGTKNPDTTPIPPSNNTGGGSSDGGTWTPSAPTAPTGLQGMPPTSSIINNGKITGLDSTKTYQYKLVTATTWINVPASSTEITSLVAGVYEVRIAANGSTPASPSTLVTIQAANPVQSQAPQASEIRLVNFETAGPDLVQVSNVPADATVKVYDASTNGNVIGSFITTQAGYALVQIINGFEQDLDKVYVTITETGKSESDREEKGVPTTFPDAPEISDITVTDNPTGIDTVTVKVPLPNSEYMISVYDTTGKQLSDNIVPNGALGEITVGVSNGFANGLTEIDVAIVKISDNGTQYAESFRTRIGIPQTIEVIENLTVTAVDDPLSNDKTIIAAGTLDSGNEFAYKIFDNETEANAGKPIQNNDVSDWTLLPADGKISVANDKVVVVVERTTTSKLAKKVGQVNAVTTVNNQLLEAVMLDGKDGVSSQDGKVETIRLKFSANIDPTTVANDTFMVNGFTIDSIKVTDKNGRTPKLSDGVTPNPLYTQGENKYITILVTPTNGTDFTPMVIQNPNSVIRDVNGVEITGINIQAKDQAAPVIISSDFIDVNANGMDAGDKINIIFSENVNLITGTDLAVLVNDFTLNKTADFAFDNSDSFLITGNVVTVTLGAATAANLSHGTTITMSSIGNDISLVDVAGNKAKPQKEFVSETVYSNPKSIDINGIPEVIEDTTPPTIVEAKIIKNQNGKYDRVQIKFSENINDSTVDNSISAFKIYGSRNSQGTDYGTVTGFSTDRTDGIIDTDVNDEYITISYEEKDSVTRVEYIRSSSDITDLSGNKLANQTITPINNEMD
ncbi:S-layer homology domain-containing protein [Bacillus sp. CGMCC 1.16607]|uniref:S-layer homology domain-containing protein n=1 Tax=Bacillus sp. CGMCC 1.16607 TaxID=3351842 RepID=UPI0036378614